MHELGFYFIISSCSLIFFNFFSRFRNRSFLLSRRIFKFLFRPITTLSSYDNFSLGIICRNALRSFKGNLLNWFLLFVFWREIIINRSRTYFYFINFRVMLAVINARITFIKDITIIFRVITATIIWVRRARSWTYFIQVNFHNFWGCLSPNLQQLSCLVNKLNNFFQLNFKFKLKVRIDLLINFAFWIFI